MVRFILGTKPASVAVGAAPAARSRAGTALQGPALEARLRQRRSEAYVAAMTRLDAGGHAGGATTTRAWVEAIRQELGDVTVESQPIGIVARCYLGSPYEVHTLDCTGEIIRHYKNHESLPGALEAARTLALHPGYAFVEVYSTRLIAVAHAGETAVVDLSTGGSR